MRFLVLGAGAVGSYFGGRLIQNGADVTFLVREDSKRRLDEFGLSLASPFGDFKAHPRSVTAKEIAGPFDVVFLGCKAYDLEQAIEAVKQAVGPATAILPTLNGIAHIGKLNREFGPERVLGGLAKIQVVLDSDGTVRHLSEWRGIVFGEQDGTMGGRTREIQEAFPTDSVSASAVADIVRKMWEKAVHLATAAGVTCLMRGSVGKVASVDGGSEVFLRLLRTHAEIATKEGFAPSEEFLAEYRALFRDVDSKYIPSMLRDLERGKPTEGEHVLGYMHEKAEEHKIDTDLLSLVMVNLRTYDVRRFSGRLPC